MLLLMSTLLVATTAAHSLPEQWISVTTDDAEQVFWGTDLCEQLSSPALIPCSGGGRNDGVLLVVHLWPSTCQSANIARITVHQRHLCPCIDVSSIIYLGAVTASRVDIFYFERLRHTMHIHLLACHEHMIRWTQRTAPAAAAVSLFLVSMWRAGGTCCSPLYPTTTAAD